MKSLFYTVLLFFVLVKELYAFQVTGRVTADKPLENGAVVYFKSDKEVYQTKTDDRGYFNIDLPEGLYFIIAEGEISGKKYRGISGRSPLLINTNEHLGIKMFPFKKVKSRPIRAKGPVIEIKLLYENKPVANGRVYFYLKPGDIKGMPYFYSLPTDTKGTVKVRELLEGSYYVIGKKKKDNNPLGPLSEGDLMGFLLETPFYFKNGHFYSLEIDLFKKSKDEFPTLTVDKKPLYIKGKILDKNGNPIEGLYAFAYDKKIIGHEKPVAISKPTGKDGVFVLPLPGKGRYYLGVRQYYGGTPVQGELYGLYQGTFDHHIDVEQNIEDIEIFVDKILK